MGRLAIKVDVDTCRGTREGMSLLCRKLEALGAPALFLFSLGPDNTGKAIKKIFRPGFFKKCLRSNVAGNYGIRTLLNGTLLPAPIIGKRCAEEIKAVYKSGFGCGIHCWDHFNWQENLTKLSAEKIRKDFEKAYNSFEEILGFKAKCCGAPGWQCTKNSLEVQDKFDLLMASDVRGYSPFIPKIDGKVFKTPQIPSTLPTLDELLGEIELADITKKYLELAEKDGDHVMTIHSELEGLAYLDWFSNFLAEAKINSVEFIDFNKWMLEINENKTTLPVCDIKMDNFPGRSGNLAQQV